MAYGQPDLDHPIATEFQDPALIPGPIEGWPACASGRLCRFSDAAVFTYNSGISWSFPYVADAWCGFGPPICYRDPPYYVVSGVTAYLDNGIFKVGRTTGFTTGTVTDLCVNAPQYDESGDTGRTMLCQTVADYYSAGGDSGSPVVMNSGGTYYWVGIHWGGAPGVDGKLFSPWHSVLAELAGNSPYSYSNF
jgi:hypothetical protein